MRRLIFVSTGLFAMLAIGMTLGYLVFGKPSPVPSAADEREAKKEREPSFVADEREAKKERESSFVLDSHQELKFKDGITMDVWDVRATRIRELTVRLLIIADGKSQVAREEKLKWDNWPKEQAEEAWQLYYLLQDNQALGAKRERVPSFTIRFGSAKPRSSTGMRSTLSVDGEFSTPSTSTSAKAAINASEESVVYVQIHNPAKWSGTIEFGRTVESLIKIANGGRVIVALTLEWK